MEELSYRIDDKIIAEILGKQNFTSDESAVLELVKNAYDAEATKLYLTFGNDMLTIKDNGCGMNSDDIRTHWMHVGYSDKGYKVTDRNNNTRVLSGSKGIGRFALSRLGTTVEMHSKKNGYTGIIWRTDWVRSSLTDDQDNQENGTKIIISGLHQSWTQKKVQTLKEFLSRTYHDNSMTIIIQYPGINDEAIHSYFPNPQLGINCLSIIRLQYEAENKKLSTHIVSDEFLVEAEAYCQGINIKLHCEINDIFADLRAPMADAYTDTELANGLELLGDFSAEFYFVNHPTKEDMDKFCYKYEKMPDKMSDGIILYRNAFSIASFDGKKDWLGLGKRSRKSPASPTHPTGSWRVRENQISGMVQIDKKRNLYLTDISNRQGLEENFQYQLFIYIIQAGISNFERYRQGIIRCINKKNKIDDYNDNHGKTPIADKIALRPSYASQLSAGEAQKLAEEIKSIKEEKKSSRTDRYELEGRYKYDVRILNALSTIGLKAAAIAHEMRNDRNAIQYNVDYTIDALKEYGMWDTLSDSEHTTLKFRNIPQLLEEDKRVSQKLVSFMDAMLTDIQKDKFVQATTDVSESINRICRIWERDYEWVQIHVNVEEIVSLQVHEDVIQVVLDNLILNSIQQNPKNKLLEINISAKQKNNAIQFVYNDYGKGLDPKYASNPRKILEVHETTRPDGHGLGMWIVNNTVTMTGGEIKNIVPAPGFAIEFSIGGIS